MDPIERLTELFERFPGIGPRQAQRFVQFLLRSPAGVRREVADAIQHLGGSVRQCSDCMRWHAGSSKVCSICSNTERDASLLAIVAADADLAALEKSGTYRGRYFVLGGTISLASEQAKGLRIRQLLDSLGQRVENGLREVILAFPANPEGDMTALRMRDELDKSTDGTRLKITTLGRGLSTGSELEYADPETLRSAMDNRK